MGNLPSPNVVDIAALIICIIGIIQGLRRGLSGEIARLIGVVVAFILGVFFYRPFGSWLVDRVRISELAFALAFILTVMGAAVIMVLVRLLLKRIMVVVFEPHAEKIGGAIAGFLRMSFFVLIVFVMMNMWPNESLNRLFGEDSVIGSQVMKISPVIEEELEDIEELTEEIEEKASDWKMTEE